MTKIAGLLAALFGALTLIETQKHLAKIEPDPARPKEEPYLEEEIFKF